MKQDQGVSPLIPLFLRLFGALAIVLALFLGGVWAFRNWHRLGQARSSQHLRILESRSLGGRHALHVVGYIGDGGTSSAGLRSKNPTLSVPPCPTATRSPHRGP